MSIGGSLGSAPALDARECKRSSGDTCKGRDESGNRLRDGIFARDRLTTSILPIGNMNATRFPTLYREY